jgi:methyl-accepting chemotaxis protein
MSDPKSSFKVILAERDCQLYERWQAVKEYARDILRDDVYDSNYRGRAMQHVLSLENIVDIFIPDSVKEQLNAVEVFVLLCGLVFHDIGMEIKEADETDEEVARDHHERAQKYVIQKHVAIGLNNEEAECIGYLCYGHTMIDIKVMLPVEMTVNSTQVRVQFLTAILRLVDMLDFEIQPPLLGLKEQYWETRNAISNIDVDSTVWMIKIQPSTKGLGSRKSILKLRERIQKDLDRNRSILNRHGIYYRHVEVDSIYEYVSELESQLNQQRASIQELERKTQEYEENKYLLQTRMQELEGENVALSLKIKRLDDIIDDQEQRMQGIEKDRNRYLEDIDRLQKQVDSYHKLTISQTERRTQIVVALITGILGSGSLAVLITYLLTKP